MTHGENPKRSSETGATSDTPFWRETGCKVRRHLPAVQSAFGWFRPRSSKVTAGPKADAVTAFSVAAAAVSTQTQESSVCSRQEEHYLCMMPVAAIVWACPNAAGLRLLRKHACHSCADSDRGTQTRTSLDTNPSNTAVCVAGQMARRAQKKETISKGSISTNLNILTGTPAAPRPK